MSRRYGEERESGHLYFGGMLAAVFIAVPFILAGSLLHQLFVFASKNWLGLLGLAVAVALAEAVARRMQK